MTHRTPLRRLLLGLALITAGLSAGAHADNEQYFPLQSYRVGPYAAGGTGFFGGFIDYLQYINAKGGVNGVKLTWSECETEYVVEKGVECYERLKGASTARQPPRPTRCRWASPTRRWTVRRPTNCR